MEKDTQVNFGDPTGRERLEFEVSQLADDTLSESRRASVLAAVSRDESLQAMLKDFQRIDARLTRQPDWAAVDLSALEHSVMDIVHRDLATEGVSIPLHIPAATPAADGTTGGAWRVTPWSSAVAAAAALVIGLGIGAVLTHDTGPGTLQVDGPSQSGGAAVAAGEIEIVGPGAVRLESYAASNDPAAADSMILSVSGPGGAADPSEQSTFADVVARYAGAPNVVETPSRVVVASADASSETD